MVISPTRKKRRTSKHQKQAELKNKSRSMDDEDLFSAFDEDASTSRPVPSTSSIEDQPDSKDKSEADSSKR